MKQNEHGFSLAVIAGAIVVVSAISGAGWFVFNRNKDTKIGSTAQQETRDNEDPIENESENLSDTQAVEHPEDQSTEEAPAAVEPTLKMLLGEGPGHMYDNVSTYADYGTSTLKREVKLITTGIDLGLCTLQYMSAASKTDSTITLNTLKPLASQEVAFSAGWHVLSAECPAENGTTLKAEKSFGVIDQ